MSKCKGVRSIPCKKVNPASLDVLAQRREELKKLFPETVREGQIDFDRLKKTLDGSLIGDAEGERYGLSWAGKNDCFRHIQEPTTATLKPIRKQSVDFDQTQNLFIEGDNLQVLKVLQKSYDGAVKMIYIDPPYNTGMDGKNRSPAYKRFLTEVPGRMPTTWWPFNEAGHNDEAKKEIFTDVNRNFDTPKPVRLINQMLKIGTHGKDDIILDFFAGSCLTAHAVMQLNCEDGGHSYYRINGGKLIICLEDKITKKLVDAILKEKPEKALCLDRAFENNDQLKTNTILQMESEKIEFKVI